MKLYPVRQNHASGAVDRNGTVVIDFKFESIGEFSEGLAAFTHQDKDGYIDSTGRVVIEPQYELAGPFRNGFAIIQQNGREGFISKNNTYLVEPRLERAREFSSNRFNGLNLNPAVDC